MELGSQSLSNKTRFDDLVASVQHCNLCPRLCDRTKVLSEANGSLETKVLFVAEAPGRLGADRTRIPLCGDKTGNNFEQLLSNIGWSREQAFITNAVLCNPRQENGNNATPTAEEIANCSWYLEMVISLIKPDVVVTLGASALHALDLISPHGIDLRDGVAKLVPWFGFTLFPLYHPGSRAMVHRSLVKQRSDFVRLAKLVDPVKGLVEVKKTYRKTKPSFPCGTDPLQQVARAFLELAGGMTYFKLTKLVYLFDLQALRVMGRTFASDIYLRQVDGPWPPKLDAALKAMEGYEIRRFFSRRVPVVSVGPSPRTEIQLHDDILEIIADVWKKYGTFNNSEIKAAVYRTEPMRFILQLESNGKDMRNKPVIYKDRTASQT